MLAVGDGLHHQILGHAIAADQLNDDIDFRILDQLERIGSYLGCATGDLLGQFDVTGRPRQ